MSNADAQVITMVNAPHEERARREKERKVARRRQARAQKAVMLLIIKLELCLIGVGLAVIAAAHGVVADWLAVLGVAVLMISGAVEVGRQIGR